MNVQGMNCLLCGKNFEHQNNGIDEKNESFWFDDRCLVLFKRFTGIYGNEFFEILRSFD
jgi:hypothetical protein